MSHSPRSSTSPTSRSAPIASLASLVAEFRMCSVLSCSRSPSHNLHRVSSPQVPRRFARNKKNRTFSPRHLHSWFFTPVIYLSDIFAVSWNVLLLLFLFVLFFFFLNQCVRVCALLVSLLSMIASRHSSWVGGKIEMKSEWKRNVFRKSTAVFNAAFCVCFSLGNFNEASWNF